MPNKCKIKTNDVKEKTKLTMSENKLQKMRIKKNMTQSLLAEKSGVSVRTIQNLEQGRRDLNKSPFEIVYKLAKALECDIAELYSEEK